MTGAATGPRPANRWLYLAMAALLATSVAVQVVRDRGWQPYEPQSPMLWLRSAPLVKRLAVGYDSLVADVYWMRAVVYYGGNRRSDEAQRNFDLLYPLLDLVTSLDPRFKVAYRFGAIFLTEGYPNGPGRPDLAVALLKRAIDSDTSHWEYMQDIAFIYYWWLRDYRTAAEWFGEAAKEPDAPAWMAPLAATTLATGGDRRSSRFLWQKILDGTDVDWLKTNARHRLLQLDAMDMLDELNQVSGRFTAREGHPPRDWRELAAGERLRGVPLDPTGAAFTLDPSTGRIDLAQQSLLRPLPTDAPGPSPVPR